MLFRSAEGVTSRKIEIVTDGKINAHVSTLLIRERMAPRWPGGLTKPGNARWQKTSADSTTFPRSTARGD